MLDRLKISFNADFDSHEISFVEPCLDLVDRLLDLTDRGFINLRGFERGELWDGERGGWCSIYNDRSSITVEEGMVKILVSARFDDLDGTSGPNDPFEDGSWVEFVPLVQDLLKIAA